MNYPCENCIKADVCKYKEEIKDQINKFTMNDQTDIITITYTCKYAKYNSIARFDTTPIPCYSNTTTYDNENSWIINPALGTGQIQIKDIHYVTYQYRTTWEMCQLLDQKYLHSSRRTFDDFYREATKNQWIKN